MADVLITDLPPYTDYDGNDIFPVTDITTNTTRGYKWSEVLNGLRWFAVPLSNGTAGVTQDVHDTSTLLATDAFVHNLIRTVALTYDHEIDTTTDLNTIISTGIYAQLQDAPATTGVNYPVTVAGKLDVLAKGVFVYQTYTTRIDGRIFNRTKINSTWSTWSEVFSTNVTHNSSEKTTLVDSDEFPVLNSGSSFGVSKNSWLTLKNNIKAYLDPIYSNLVSPTFTGTVNANNIIAQHIQSNTDLVVKGKILAAEGAGTSGGYSFELDGATDTGMFSTSDGNLRLVANNVEQLTIDNTGLYTTTAAVGNSTTQIATTEFANIGRQTHNAPNKTTAVDADELSIWNSVGGVLNKLTFANLKATLQSYFDTVYSNLNSPTLTGVPLAPTAPVGTNTTQIATTAFVNGSSIGVGQTWKDVTSLRTQGGANINNTGITITVNVIGNTVSLNVGGIQVGYHFVSASGDTSGSRGTLSALVPNGVGYSSTGFTSFLELN